MKFHVFFFFLLLTSGFRLLTSCSVKQQKPQEAIARVYDNYLYSPDVKDIVPAGITGEDSIKLVNKFINNWIREKLIVYKAEQNLTDDQKDVGKQLEEYRNSLITYSYEKELVKQKLDTSVVDEEIEKYYNENKSNFELKDNIIKVLYVRVSKDAPDILKLKKWYKSEDEKDRIALEGYCHKYAENFYLTDDTWLLFDDILKEVPIETYNKELFLKNNRFVEMEDSAHLYLLNIKGFKIKNTLSPLSFEKENIRKIIINKRKLELINKMKEDVYQAAIKNNDFELYEKKK